MKIIHLIYSFQTGGTQTMLVDIANEQVKQAEVHIVIINQSYNLELIAKIDKRVNIHFVIRKIGSKSPIPIIKLNLLLFKIGADILHCHNHNIAPLLLPVYYKKLVLTIHDVGESVKYLKLYRKLFAISQIVKEDIYKRSNLPAVLVYNGICANLLQQKNIYTFKDFFKVIIISRLDHLKKGQHLAIEALHLLDEEGIRNIHLDLIGYGISEQYLRDLTVKYNLTDRVFFLGMLDRDNIYAHLHDYDLLLQPSLYEGFGLTVAEGMAAKVPVLVSDTDGPIEIIENGKYGNFFENNNFQSLSLSLKKIIENYNTKDFIDKIEEAYLHVNDLFSIRKTANTYIEQYNSINLKSTD